MVGLRIDGLGHGKICSAEQPLDFGTLGTGNDFFMVLYIGTGCSYRSFLVQVRQSCN
jgi:hypothetical protein